MNQRLAEVFETGAGQVFTGLGRDRLEDTEAEGGGQHEEPGEAGGEGEVQPLAVGRRAGRRAGPARRRR